MTKFHNWRFRLQRSFFGLTDEYMASVYEEFFILKHHGGWSFIEAYNLPVALRRWFVERLAKHFEDEERAMKKATSKSGRS